MSLDIEYVHVVTHTEPDGISDIYTMILESSGICVYNIEDLMEELNKEFTDKRSKPKIYIEDMFMFYYCYRDYILEHMDRTNHYFFTKENRPRYFTIGRFKFLTPKGIECKCLQDVYDLCEEMGWESTNKIPNSFASDVRSTAEHKFRAARKNVLQSINRTTEETKKAISKSYAGGDTDKVYGEWKDTLFSFDIKSAYPFQLISREFPVGQFCRLSEKAFKNKDNGDPYIATIKLKNVQGTGVNKSIMKRWCADSVNAVWTDKDRLKSADEITLTMTNIDIDIIDLWYEYESKEYTDYYICYIWEPLPTLITDMIKEAFLKKEENKKYKKRLNMIYGCFCFDPASKGFRFEEDTREDEEEKLPFQIGVFCTAYARKELNDLLYKLRDWAVYWDTDCIKGLYDEEEYEEVKAIVQEYNDSLPVVEDIPEIGRFQDEGVHNMQIFACKKYITFDDNWEHGVATYAGVTTDAYKDVTEDTVFTGGHRCVCEKDGKVQIILRDATFYNDSVEINL